MRCVWSFGKIATRDEGRRSNNVQLRKLVVGHPQHSPDERTHALHLGMTGLWDGKEEVHQNWGGNWKVALLCGFVVLAWPRASRCLSLAPPSGCCTCPPCTRGVLAESGRDSRCREDLRQDERLGKQAKRFCCGSQGKL